jgi:hypothetical protein
VTRIYKIYAACKEQLEIYPDGIEREKIRQYKKELEKRFPEVKEMK